MTRPTELLLVGCGLMGKRHIQGLWELRRSGLQEVQLSGVVDTVPERAGEAAAIAQELLGKRPQIFYSLTEALSSLDIDLVDICTDVASHHVVAVEALESGAHCLVEKPLGATVRACYMMLEATRKGSAKLGLAENYRRDPVNRLARWIITRRVLGAPQGLLHAQAGGGDTVLLSPWRHSRAGDILLDLCCHYTDIVNYYFGEPERVQGYATRIRSVRHMREIFSGRIVKKPLEAEAEDYLDATFIYGNGMVAKLLVNLAAAGEGLYYRAAYFDEGSMIVPQERTGGPVKISRHSDEDYVSQTPRTIFLGAAPAEPYKVDPQVAEEVYDEATRKLFPNILNGYNQTFQEADRKLIALELHDFIEAITEDRDPETGGREGLISTAMVLAALESSALGRPVSLKEVLELRAEAYQAQINKALGIKLDI